jgi:hypothetical protein
MSLYHSCDTGRFAPCVTCSCFQVHYGRLCFGRFNPLLCALHSLQIHHLASTSAEIQICTFPAFCGDMRESLVTVSLKPLLSYIFQSLPSQIPGDILALRCLIGTRTSSKNYHKYSKENRNTPHVCKFQSHPLFERILFRAVS